MSLLNTLKVSAPFTVRLATVDDAHTLTVIGAKTFHDTFAPFNTAENMRLYMDKTFTVNQLESELQDVNATFLLAQEGERVVGYAKLHTGKNPPELNETNSIEIERIYSCKEYIGKKVGKTLMQASLEIAAERGFETVWLGVWEHNPRAILFYEKCGFKIFGSHLFRLGTDLQTDLLMKKKLS